ncbi:regulator of Ty1 Transposition [Coemansia interrupta]|uniref:Regulator of Ty1 Transposition n=1 Tax=Coemansia interrupta TaxID=1126814 RepID=A0A9W8HHW8_9FUNG|nr:regulator of Ty1 Transposition [Coemansia interrupta]
MAQEAPVVQPRRLQLTETEQKMFVRTTDQVFGGVVYWINPSIEEGERMQIAQLLKHGGARPATLREHGERMDESKLNGVIVNGLPQMASHIARFHLAGKRQGSSSNDASVLGATHVISPDTHFGEYAECMRAGVRVVTGDWVLRSIMAGWQYVERYFSPSTRKLFSGMIVSVTHMPPGDKETLLASVMALGGQWRERMCADVTHLIVMQAQGSKYEFVQRNKQLGIRAILPHWFKESLNLLRRVPQEPFLFPDPPMLRSEDEQMALLSATQMVSPPDAESANGSAYDLPRPASACMKGYTVAISLELRNQLSDGAVARLTQRLNEAGAAVAGAVDDWNTLDVLLCQHRSGYEYAKASRLGKIVGTLVWLYQVFISGTLTPPTRRLLHYPVPVVAVEGMDRAVISVSGYTGVARQFLRTLILAMGARYTPHLSRENTHLITASCSGRKYAAAVRGGIDVVNHLWIEQCFQRWRMLGVTHPNFTYYPTLPMLNAMVGSTEIDVRRLDYWVNKPAGASIAEWSDMDVLSDSDLALSNGMDIAGGSDNEDSNQLAEEDDEDVRSISASVDGGDDEENAAATRHTSRAAAMAASRSLGEMMRAANIFEKEMRRERQYRSRTRNTMQLGADANVDAEDQSPQKQHRAGSDNPNASKRRKTESRVRIMLTHVQLTPAEEDQIYAMGGEIVHNASAATHLVIGNTFKRTLKVLLALATGRTFIVQRPWLDDSLAAGVWIDVDYVTSSSPTKSYALEDKAAEKRWGFNLRETMKRAYSRQLFQGVMVVITPNTDPGFDMLRSLVETAGGRAVSELPQKRLQKLLQANDRAVRKARAEGDTSDIALPLIVVTCPQDAHMWPQYVSEESTRPWVYNVDIVLTGLMVQRLEVFNEKLYPNRE